MSQWFSWNFWIIFFPEEIMLLDKLKTILFTRVYQGSIWKVFDTAKKKKKHYETNKSTLNLKYKGLNKNPISCEFYSEVLAKFLIVNQRVEGLSNTAFIPTVLSTGCGIERILCDNDKHLRMSSNLQMWLFEWSPLHKQYILQWLVLESKRWNTGPIEEVRKFL